MCTHELKLVCNEFPLSVPGLQVYRLMNDIPSALADLEKAIELSRGKCIVLCVDVLIQGIELNRQCTNLCTAGLQQADYYFVGMDCETQDSNHML